MKKINLLIATERQTQNAIKGYLEYKGYYVMRMNSGKMRYTSANGRQGLVSLHEAGTPDLLALKPNNVVFVEVKRVGNKPTPLQLAKMDELRRYGALCVVAYGIEDLEKYGI